MGRRIFISFQHDDKAQVQGFLLLKWNQYVEFDFVGRHLLSPINSENEAYIRRKILEEIHGTSVNTVLIGEKTAESEWVRWEVEKCLEKNKGVIGIRLKGAEDAPTPTVLKEAKIRVIDWNPSTFEEEIERAALITGRQPLGAPPGRSASSGGSCVRY